MKNKILVFLSSVFILFAIFTFGKNIYLKKIIKEKLSIALQQPIEIKKANISLLNNSFSLKDVLLTKDNIIVKNISVKMNFKEFIKNNNNFIIDNLTLSEITLEKISNNENLDQSKIQNSLQENDKASEYIKEIDKKINAQDNLSKFFKVNFDKDNFSKSISDGLIDFLIKNVDYIDLIIQKEINRKLNKKIIFFNARSKEILNNLKNYNHSNSKNNILIKNVSFTGNILNINFSGNFKNFNTNLTKNTSLPVNIKLSQNEGIGDIYGDINTNNLTANIYIKLSNVNTNSLSLFNKYLSHGILSSEQVIKVYGNNISIDGNISLDKISINKEFLINSNKLDNIKKSILLEIINLSEKNYSSFKLSNNFTNNSEFISIKTNIPEEIKSTLISNRSTFSNFLQRQLKDQYKGEFEDKKNKIKNFFKNIF